MDHLHLCTEKEFTPTFHELEVVLNSTHDAMIAVNKQGIVNVVNNAAEKFLGVTAQEALGRPVHHVIPNSRLEIVLKTGIPELNQQQHIGSACIVTNRVPVRDESGQVVGAVAVFRDITEIRQLAEEITNLKEIQEMLEAIINSSQDAISVVNENEKIVLVNPAYTRLVGMTKEEVLGKSPTVDIQEGESMHLKVMKTMRPVRGVPLHAGPQGKEVIVNAAPIIVNGRLRGSVAISHDVSEIKHLTAELDHMKSLVRRMISQYTADDIIGSSKAIRAAVEQALKAAATPATVLLAGESGTGKELFAHAIYNASSRKSGPFIRVNCAAIPDTLLESELFGYEGGAFTGARKTGKKGLVAEANGGTIFLDEISEIPPMIQAKLLRFLQEKEITPVGSTKSIKVDTRIIAASNVDLEKAVQRNAFREDLFYRISVFPIFIPPLRERLEDLPELVNFLLKKLNKEYGRDVRQMSPEALAVLSHYHWPGNIRELENVLGRALINMRPTENTVLPQYLPPLATYDRHTAGHKHSQPTCDKSGCQSLASILEAAEQKAIEDALAAHGGNRVEAAHSLGIAVRSLYYKLEKYRHK